MSRSLCGCVGRAPLAHRLGRGQSWLQPLERVAARGFSFPSGQSWLSHGGGAGLPEGPSISVEEKGGVTTWACLLGSVSRDSPIFS